MNQHMVKTFDGLTLPFTPLVHSAETASCEMLITQDCSSGAQLAVLASGDQSSWKLRFLVQGYEIEWMWRGALVVRVNAQEKHLTPSRPIVIRQQQRDSRSSILVFCSFFSPLLFDCMYLFIAL